MCLKSATSTGGPDVGFCGVAPQPLGCPFPPELSGWWWRKTEEEELNVPLLVLWPADSVRTLLLRTVHLAPFLSNKSSPTKYFKANSWCNEYLNTPNTIPQIVTTIKIPTQWKEPKFRAQLLQRAGVRTHRGCEFISQEGDFLYHSLFNDSLWLIQAHLHTFQQERCSSNPWT